MDGIRPTLERAVTLPDGTQVILTFSETLSETTAPASAFAVLVAGSSRTVNTATTSGATVTLTLDSAVMAGETVTVAYVDPTANDDANAVQDEAGNDAASFAAQTVTNIVGTGPSVESIALSSGPGTDATYAIGDAVEATVTFREAVDVDVSGGIPELEIDVGGTPQTLNYRSGTGTAALVFTGYTVAELDAAPDGIAVGVNKLTLNGGTIAKAGDRSTAAVLIHAAVPAQPAHKVDGVRPTLVTSGSDAPVTSIDGTQVILTFSETLSGTTATTSTFAILVEGSSRTVDSATASVNTVTLTLDPAVAAGETVTVAYDDPTANDDANAVQDAAGNDAASFTAQTVTNTVEAPPSVSSVALTSDPGADATYALGDTIRATVTFTAAVDVNATGNQPQLELDIGGTPEPAVYESGTGTTALVFAWTVADNREDADGIEIGANKLTLNGGTIRKAGDASVDALLDHTAVDADSGHRVDGVRPALLTSGGDAPETSTDGTQVILTFSEALSQTTAPASAFTVMVADSSRTVNTATASGTEVTLTLDSAVAAGETVTVAYDDPTANDDANAVQDAAGNDAASFTAQTVTNTVEAPPSVSSVALTSIPGADATYALGDTVRATVTFTAAVDVNATGNQPQLELDIGGAPQPAAYESGTGTTALVFAWTVADNREDADGIEIGANKLTLNGGTITKAGDASVDALLDHTAVAADSGHKVDGVRPALLTSGGDAPETSTDGTQVILTFSETLSGTTATTGAFTVSVANSSRTVNTATASGTEVTLTLDPAAAAGETVTVAYEDPTANDDPNAVQDAAGNDAASFTAQTVTNNVEAPPSVSSVALTSDPGADATYAIGDTVRATVTFTAVVDVNATGNQPQLELDIGGAPQPAAYESGTGTTALVFAWTVADNREDADGIEIGANKLILNGGTIRKAGSTTIDADLDHAAVAADGGHKVDGVRPALLTSGGDAPETSTDGTQVILTFSEALSETTAPASAFTVSVADSSRTVDSVAANGTEVTLTLDSAVAAGETVTVAYEDPTANDDANAVQDAAGNDAASFDAQAVTNTVPGTTTTAGTIIWSRTMTVATYAEFVGYAAPSVGSLSGASSGSGQRRIVIGEETFKVDTLGQYTSDNQLVLNIVQVDNTTRVDLPGDDDLVLELEQESSPGSFLSYRLADDEVASVGGYGWSTTHEGSVLPSGQGSGDTLTVRLVDTGSGTTNTAATGKPAISGTATVGGMLTAGTSGIADAEGKTRAENGDAGFAYTYQWVRINGSTETDISAATSNTYTLAPADAGGKVKVKVSFQDDAGNAEGPLASDAYPSTGAVLVAPSVSQVALTSNSGTDETYAIGNIVAATVTFSSEVDVVTTDGPVHLVLDIGGQQEKASCAAATNVTEVSCTHEVREGNTDADGISYAENALTLSGGAVTVTGSSVGANLDHDAAGNQSAHKVDGIRPTLSRAVTWTDGAKIVLTFDEALSETTAASADFTVMVADSSRTISSVAASGMQATLTLASAVAAGETVTVAYEDPTQNDDANAVQDAFGNDAESFSAAESVTNSVVAQGTLMLILDTIAEDDTVNMAEHVAGFTISGNTDSEGGVSVTVTVDTTELTATSSATSTPATWSVSVPPNADYIIAPSIIITVSASKTSFAAPADVMHKLAVDLTAPTPSYTAPGALQVGVPIKNLTASTTATDIDRYSATGLPSGLDFDTGTGVISGTPDMAAANPATATVTVTDTAGNPADASITFPVVDKGDQKLADFSYNPDTVTFGSAAPTVAAPTEALTPLSYSATPATVCMVDSSTGALTLLAVGKCEVTATAESDANYNEATAEFTVTVQSAGTFALNVDAIAGDDTVNIAERGTGFTIDGDTGSEGGVSVTVTVGTTELTATSSATSTPATWSVNVPANAGYITESIDTVTVSASKAGFTAPTDVKHTLTVDLTAPTTSYTAPDALQVGMAIADIEPSTSATDIASYSATGLPSGLAINRKTGVIGGTPNTAASPASATVTVTDTAGNPADAPISFPEVAKGEQTLAGFGYDLDTVTFGDTAPKLIAPTAARTTVSYSATPADVCAVGSSTGALTLLAVGVCEITAAAEADANYNQAAADFTVTVRPIGTLVLNLDTIAGDNTVNIAEHAAGFTISGDTDSEGGVTVTVMVDKTELTATSSSTSIPATWSVSVLADASYVAESSVPVTVSASKTGFTAPGKVTRELAVDLTAPSASYTAPNALQVGVAIDMTASTTATGIVSYSASGLPSGLSIDTRNGAIIGTPDTADPNPTSATVTVTDPAGNPADASIAFPAVDKGDQKLADFGYNPDKLNFGDPAPTVTAPTEAQTTVSYSATPAEVCTVNATSGALTLDGAGECVVTATAKSTDNYNQATADFTVTVAKGDQKLADFAYIPDTVMFGDPAPTLTAPTGALTTLSYSATPAEVCTVNATSGPLTLAGAGDCVVTVTAEETANYNQATADFTVTVAKGEQTLTGFAYTPATVMFGDTAPTLTVPTGAQGTLSYSASPAELCTVDMSTGALTLVGTGTCTITTTAAGTANYDAATAMATVTVQTAATLVLTLGPIADDDTVNIVEKADGFMISGDTGSEAGVTVSVTIGSQSALTTTSSNANPATWSVDVPPNAAYLAEPSVTVTVSSTKVGFTVPSDVTRDLTVDLAAPSVSYPAPGTLKVGVAITEMMPSFTATDIVSYAAMDLPPGLSIDAGTGIISGTPDTANDSPATATVTVTDAAGNPADASLAFPAVAKGNQTLVGFDYSPDTVTFGDTAPSLTAPTGAQIAVLYSASPAEVCTVDATNGALTLVGAGTCTITATASSTTDYNEVTVDFTVTVAKAEQTLTGFAYTPATLTFGDAAPTLTAPTGAQGTLSYAATPAEVCTVDTMSGALTLDGAGECVVTATAEETANYIQATADFTVSVAKGDQTLAGFGYSPATVTFGDTAPTVTAPTGAQGTLSYAATPAEVCTVDATSGALTLVGVGDCMVTATAESTDNYNPATAEFTVTVAKGEQTLTGFLYTPATVNFGSAAPTLTAPTGAEGSLSYAASPAEVCTVDGTSGALTLDGAGECVVTATAESTDNYNPATAEFTVTVAKGDQTLTGFLYTPATVNFGSAAPTLTAPTGAEGSLSYAASPAEVCTVNATSGALTLVGVGDCVVTATAESTANYNQATADFTVTVAKGEQTLTGFLYTPATVNFGDAAPTLTAPTGARTTLSYTATPAEVCTVNATSGALMLVGIGTCTITATAESGANYDEATVTATVTVEAADALVLNLGDIAGDDTVNIVEHEAGFPISGDTGSEAGVTVSVTIGSQSPQTTTSAANGAWSVDVPPNAAYITGTSVTVTVSATKTGFTAAIPVTRTLIVDLAAPSASYPAPATLQVGVAITAMTPSTTASDIASYAATGLPPGLSIDDTTGVITGTPDTAATAATATVRVTDTAGNPADVSILFPEVAKGDQTLTGLAYTPATVNFGDAAPTLTAPTGAEGSLSYAASPAEVCTVDATSGALTLVGVGDCMVTATAESTDNYNPATAEFTVTVAKGEQTLTGFLYTPATVNFGSAAPTLTAPTGAEGSLSYAASPAEVCTVNATSGALTLAGAGDCVVTATAESTANYNQATADFTVTVAKGEQTPADFAYTPATVIFGDAAPTLTAPTGAEGSLSYAASPAEVCTVNATSGALTLAGAGDCVVTATAESTANYNQATADFTVTVAKGEQTPADFAYTPATVIFGDAAPTLTAPTGAEGSLSYAASPAEVCTVDATSGALTLVGVGDCMVTATAESTDNYNPATAEFTVTVAKGEQTLTGFLYTLATVNFGSAAPTLTAPTGAEGSLSYAASPAEVCTVNATSGALTLDGTGDCVVTATAESTDNYNQATADFTVSVAKGEQTLTGFLYTPATVNFGSAAPTLTAPTGARTTLSYTATPAEVCTVNATSGALMLVGTGTCTITATAEGTANYDEATAMATVTVEAADALVLNLGTIAGDDTVNIAEKADGFAISGNTGSEAGVMVSVTIGSQSALTTTSSNANPATWSVDVPTNADYLTGTSVTVTVSATKTGFTAAIPVTRTLIVDLAAPSASYPAPATLQVGVAITAMTPSTTASDIASYAATGLPPGLSIDDTTGVITGTPDTAATAATATVRVTDTAGNPADVSILFPEVAKGDQTLTGLAYTPATVNFGDAAPTLTAPTGAPGPLSYAATPAEVCTVDATSGALTLDGTGECVVTATAESTDDYNEATADFTVTVDRGEQPLAGFAYTPATVTFSDDAPTLMAPTGAQGTLSYAAMPAEVCTVNATNGALTLAGVGACVVTATAAETANYNEATADFTVTVDRGEQPLAGFAYTPATVTFGDDAPTLMAPTGAQTTLSYAATPAEVCTVDMSTGALTLVGVGTCTITVTAASDDNYNEATADFTVTVQPAAKVTVSVAVAPAVAEGTPALFTVTLSGAVASDVALDWSTADGTATAGADYTAVSSRTVTFVTGGSLTQTISVTTLRDLLAEGNETFTVTLAASGSGLPAGVSLGTATATGTIEDDDPIEASVAATAGTVTEGGAAQFTVTLSSATSTAAVVVSYTVGGTATAGTDYTAPAATVTLPAGAKTGTISIPTLDDSVLDPGETLTVTLDRAATTAGVVTVSATAASATTTITDPGMVMVSVAPASAPEGEAVVFTVNLSGAVASNVAFEWSTTDGTATAGEDYTAVSGGTVTFVAGESLTRTISVTTREDAVAERDETFTVTLAAAPGTGLPEGVSLGTATATGTIADDDEPGIVLSTATLTVREGDRDTWEVALASEPTATTTIEVSSDSADATVSPMRLTFTAADWSRYQTVTVDVTVDDDKVEADATVNLSHTASGADEYAPLTETVELTIPGFEDDGETRTVKLRVPETGLVTVPDGTSAPGGVRIYLPDEVATTTVVSIRAVADQELDSATPPPGFREGNVAVDIELGDGASLPPDTTATVCFPMTGNDPERPRVWRYDAPATPPEWVELPEPAGGLAHGPRVRGDGALLVVRDRFAPPAPGLGPSRLGGEGVAGALRAHDRAARARRVAGAAAGAARGGL